MIEDANFLQAEVDAKAAIDHLFGCTEVEQSVTRESLIGLIDFIEEMLEVLPEEEE